MISCILIYEKTQEIFMLIPHVILFLSTALNPTICEKGIFPDDGGAPKQGVTPELIEEEGETPSDKPTPTPDQPTTPESAPCTHK